MSKLIKNTILAASTVIIVACSSGGNSNNNSNGNNATNYGGVDQPAAAAYYFSESGNTHSAMIRLTNESSGIMYFNSSVTPNMNLKSAITDFNKSNSTCLPPTKAEGVVSNVKSTLELSLTNCVAANNIFSATLSIKKDSTSLYESSVVFHNVEIANYNQVKALSDIMPESSPVLYYVPMANVGKLNFSVPILGIMSDSLSNFGIPFGELMSNFVSGTSVPYQMDIGSANVTYKVIDSTSLMMSISNIHVNNTVISATMRPQAHNNSSTAVTVPQQVECNVITSGMVVNNQLNPDMHGFLTGCDGVVSTTIGDVQVVDGTIAVYGLN